MFQTEATSTSDRSQRPLWWNTRCDSTTAQGQDHCEGQGLDERRQCAWEQAVDEAQGDDPSPEPPEPSADLTIVEHRAFGGELLGEHLLSQPCPLCPPVQGPPADELMANVPCTKPGCGRECSSELTISVRWNGQDGEGPCDCEHHDPSSGWLVAAVQWLREGR